MRKAAKRPMTRGERMTHRLNRGCHWFALCRNDATGSTPHPILGDVPTCDRCHKFATGENRA